MQHAPGRGRGASKLRLPQGKDGHERPVVSVSQ